MVKIFEGEEKLNEYHKKYKSEGVRYSELKDELAEAVYRELTPIQEKRHQLEKDTSYVDKVLEEGAKKARFVAEETVNEVKTILGL